MATILDGKKLSEKILNELRKKLKKSGKKLQIAGILVGSDKASKIFLAQKEKACKKVGVGFELYRFPKNVSQKTLVKKVKEICRGKNHGIIIQLPLPKQINTQEVLNLIPSKKDVDLLSEKSRNSKILAPVLGGILELFREYKIKIKGKIVVVVGRGRLVGQPVAVWMAKHGAKVFIVDKKTPKITNVTKKADILISGVGKPGLIKGNMVKRGAVVVDAAGDVDFKTVFPKASYITPIPGGVGPMTVAIVIKNLFLLNKN